MRTRHTSPIATDRPPRVKKPRKPSAPKTLKPVELTLNLPHATHAAVAGTFNNWDFSSTPMNREPEGGWKATIFLAPGRYEYRFVADGQWLSDPAARDSVENEFGSTNSVLVVMA